MFASCFPWEKLKGHLSRRSTYVYSGQQGPGRIRLARAAMGGFHRAAEELVCASCLSARNLYFGAHVIFCDKNLVEAPRYGIENRTPA